MAPYMEWTDSLNTGIRVIDDQHKRIVEYMNDLHDVSAKSDPKVVQLVLELLVDYTDTHFRFEESLMEDAKYPHLGAHRKVHALFIKKISQYRTRFDAGEDVAEPLLSTLRAWLMNHIKVEDADFVSVVRKVVKQGDEEGGGWLARRLRKLFG